ncbi:MAG: hypothetical protein VX154_00050 [Pseudomonadota bacterium]|nr:hypothetical protein [Pseudomonadota bacterium]
MANKILLTAIPTPFDVQNNLKSLEDDLNSNEQANFELAVAECLDECIRKIILQEADSQVRNQIRVYTSLAVGIAVKEKLCQQGWNASFATARHTSPFQAVIIIPLGQNPAPLPEIPTPEEFLNGAELPVFPVSILNNRESGKHRLLNECLEGIRQQQNSSDKTAVIDRKYVSDETAEDVARILRRSGWEAEVRYPMDIDHHDKVSPNMAAASARKYITISLPA